MSIAVCLPTKIISHLFVEPNFQAAMTNFRRASGVFSYILQQLIPKMAHDGRVPMEIHREVLSAMEAFCVAQVSSIVF